MSSNNEVRGKSLITNVGGVNAPPANQALSNLLNVAINTDIVWGTSVIGALYTKDIVTGATTALTVRSGDSGGSGNSGAMTVRSGVTTGSNSTGGMTVQSGDKLGIGSGSSGNLLLASGSAGGATATSGNVTVQIGTATNRGKFKIVDGSEGTVGHLWTQTAADGSGAWQAFSAGANTTLSNLGTTAINADLNPGTDNARSQGTFSLRWANITSTNFLSGTSGQYVVLTGGGPTKPSGSPGGGSLYKPFQGGGSGSLLAVFTDNNADNTNPSGSLYLETGNNTGTAGTGSIFIRPGLNTGGGSRGAVILMNQADFRFLDNDNSNYVGFKAATTITADVMWTLPSADGTNGQVLTTNGTGTLSWTTVSGGSGANQTLSNLTDPTAINADLIFNTGTTARIKTKNANTTVQNLFITAGDSANGHGGGVGISSGSSGDGSASGDVTINTQGSGGGPTGGIEVTTGIAGTSSGVYISGSGDSAGNSGGARLKSGDANDTGDTDVWSGTGVDTSGNINIRVGTATTRGKIKLIDGSESLDAGAIWMLTDTTGKGTWSREISARAYASTTVISGTLATISWNTEDYDTDDAFAGSDFVAPEAGKYQVNVMMAVAGTISLNNFANLQVQLNGTVVSEDVSYAGGAMTNLTVGVSDVINMASGDSIRVQLSCNAISPSIVSSDTRNFISIIRVR